MTKWMNKWSKLIHRFANRLFLDNSLYIYIIPPPSHLCTGDKLGATRTAVEVIEKPTQQISRTVVGIEA